MTTNPDEYPVSMSIDYPDSPVNRLCALPRVFAIPFTREYTRGLFDFVVGVFRRSITLAAYAALLITDHCPPFSLSEWTASSRSLICSGGAAVV